MTGDYVYAESDLGKGYISEGKPDKMGPLAHTKFRPFIIWADGTRTDLDDTPNKWGTLGNSAVGMLRDALNDPELAEQWKQWDRSRRS